MASRGPFPSGYGGRPEQAPGMMLREAEIERLAKDNHRLASTHVALRHDLVASQENIQRLRAHIRSTQTEADIQIRVLLEKIAKMEAEKSAGESIEEELQKAHIEAQGLLKTNQELSIQIQQASQELEIARADIKRLPEMQTELDSLNNEHQRLHTTFEYEKGWNLEKVERLKVMEKDLIAMSTERDNLRAQVANAERRARVPNPYGDPYMHNAGVYVDKYSRSMQTSTGVSGEMIGHYGLGNATGTNNVGGAAFPGSAGRAFNRSHDLR